MRFSLPVAFLAVAALAAVLLLGKGETSDEIEPASELLTARQVKAEYRHGNISRGRWVALVRLPAHQIEFVCDVSKVTARRYAAAIQGSYPDTLLAQLETDCA